MDRKRSDENGSNKPKKGYSRRRFLKQAALGTAGLTVGISAKSYGKIAGANDRVRFGVAGLNGRGQALMKAVQGVPNAEITWLCDVDSRVLEEANGLAQEISGARVQTDKDIRNLVEQNDLDAIAIATPDHWHTPMTLLGVANGKHVYVEKPCSHNPREGELLVEAMERYDSVIQMGNQQRSAPTSIEAVQDIRDGIIGEVYMGKAWYGNNRGSIGTGKQVPVPDRLDWELWQGPAPREAYRDNVVHYNWHWFWNWGTGEINNNGTHEIDICRWALGVDFPVQVTSSGGRYHYNDDWEFYDTQVASFEFEGDKLITWEGKSCNPFRYLGRGRGATIHGTGGTVLLDRNGYVAYDMDNKVIKELDEEKRSATTDTVGAGNLDLLHMQNFVDAIREGTDLHSPIDEGHRSNLLCHLGNIAQEKGRTLHTDPQNGRIQDDPDAMTMWNREYREGWEPSV